MLETSRLIFRGFVPTDANALELVLSDPQTMRFHPARLDRDGLWAMVLKSSGEPAADCPLTLQEVDGRE